MPHISKITQNLPICGWLILLNVIPSMSFNIRELLSFKIEQCCNSIYVAQIIKTHGHKLGINLKTINAKQSSH